MDPTNPTNETIIRNLCQGLQEGRTLRTIDLDLSGNAYLLASILELFDVFPLLPYLRRLRLRLHQCGLKEPHIAVLLGVFEHCQLLMWFETSLQHNECEAVYVRVHRRGRNAQDPPVNWPLLSPDVRSVVGRTTVIRGPHVWFVATITVPRRRSHPIRYILSELFDATVAVAHSRMIVSPISAAAFGPLFPRDWPDAEGHGDKFDVSELLSDRMYTSLCVYLPANETQRVVQPVLTTLSFSNLPH